MVAVIVDGRRYELSGDEVVGGGDHSGRATVTLLQSARPAPFIIGTWHKSLRHAAPQNAVDERENTPDSM